MINPRRSDSAPRWSESALRRSDSNDGFRERPIVMQDTSHDGDVRAVFGRGIRICAVISARRSGSQARRRTDAGRYLDVIKLLPYLVINEADVD